MMKGFLAAAAASLISTATLAADMPTRAPGLPPVAAPGFSWTGYYIGIDGGYGWGTADHTAGNGSANATVGAAAIPLPGASTGGVPGEKFSHDFNGGMFGYHSGYNWQMGACLWGLEAS